VYDTRTASLIVAGNSKALDRLGDQPMAKVSRDCLATLMGKEKRPIRDRLLYITKRVAGITFQDGSYQAEFLPDQGYNVEGLVSRLRVWW
jgi:hypothetical protein